MNPQENQVPQFRCNWNYFPDRHDQWLTLHFHFHSHFVLIFNDYDLKICCHLFVLFFKGTSDCPLNIYFKITVSKKKSNGQISVGRRYSNNCTKACEPLNNLYWVKRCIKGNYTNTMAVGTGSPGSYVLFPPFDRINETDILDCKGLLTYSFISGLIVCFCSKKLMALPGKLGDKWSFIKETMSNNRFGK